MTRWLTHQRASSAPGLRGKEVLKLKVLWNLSILKFLLQKLDVVKDPLYGVKPQNHITTRLHTMVLSILKLELTKDLSYLLQTWDLHIFLNQRHVRPNLQNKTYFQNNPWFTLSKYGIEQLYIFLQDPRVFNVGLFCANHVGPKKQWVPKVWIASQMLGTSQGESTLKIST